MSSLSNRIGGTRILLELLLYWEQALVRVSQGGRYKVESVDACGIVHGYKTHIKCMNCWNPRDITYERILGGRCPYIRLGAWELCCNIRLFKEVHIILWLANFGP